MTTTPTKPKVPLTYKTCIVSHNFMSTVVITCLKTNLLLNKQLLDV
jgi:hypothetical protein